MKKPKALSTYPIYGFICGRTQLQGLAHAREAFYSLDLRLILLFED